jgi:hypothetical protein
MTLGFSASKRNEYQESSCEMKSYRLVSLTTSSPSLSQLSRKFGILDISQPYGPPLPVTGIALLCFTHEESNPYLAVNS